MKPSNKPVVKWLMRMGQLALVLLVLSLTCENYLSWRGWRIPQHQDVSVHNYHIFDAQCGYLPCPGRRASLENPAVSVTVWDNYQRACREHCFVNPVTAATPKILVLGCSYTFGMGVADQDTYVWKLGKLLPNCQFANAAAIGYGPQMCLARLQREFAQGTHYDGVIYAPMRQHFERMQRSILRQGQALLVMPSVQADAPGHYSVCPGWRLNIPGSTRFLTAFYLAESLSGMLREAPWPPAQCQAAFADVVKQMQAFCQSQGAKFSVFSLDGPLLLNNNNDSSQTVAVYNILFPGLSLPENRVLNQSQNHPNARVHTFWAQQIAQHASELY